MELNVSIYCNFNSINFHAAFIRLQKYSTLDYNSFT